MAHPALLPAQIAQSYARVAERGEDASITTATAATAREINVAIQQRLHPRVAGPASTLADGTRALVGDRVATRRNDRTLTTDTGTQVRNRHVWSVTRVHGDGGLTVTDAQRGTITLPTHYVQRHVELGWAVTGYGNQGTTTDHGIAVIEPSSTRAGIYVAMTRGRHRNVAWIADPTGLADPEDALAQAIARPANALTAHAVRARLRGDRPGSIDHQPPLDPPVDGDAAVQLVQARLDRLQRASSAPEIDR